MKIERRTFKAELRAKDGENGVRKIGATAIVFNSLSENLGGYREQIDPDALNDCDMSDVRCLFNHDDNLVLGRTTSKTLTLQKNSSGLDFECNPPDTTYARDLAACMERGDIDQCSFSFTVAPGGAEWDEDPETGGYVRTVKKISRLYDVSVVTYPAYTETSAELRSSADIFSERQSPAGKTAPPASNSGGVEYDPLRRHKLELAFFEQL